MMIYGRNIDFARLFRLYLFFSLLIRHDVVERRVWSSTACGLWAEQKKTAETAEKSV